MNEKKRDKNIAREAIPEHSRPMKTDVVKFFPNLDNITIALQETTYPSEESIAINGFINKSSYTKEGSNKSEKRIVRITRLYRNGKRTPMRDQACKNTNKISL